MGHIIQLNTSNKTTVNETDAVIRAARLEQLQAIAGFMRKATAHHENPQDGLRYKHLWLVEILLDLCDYAGKQELDDVCGQLLDTLDAVVVNECVPLPK